MDKRKIQAAKDEALSLVQKRSVRWREARKSHNSRGKDDNGYIVLGGVGAHYNSGRNMQKYRILSYGQTFGKTVVKLGKFTEVFWCGRNHGDGVAKPAASKVCIESDRHIDSRGLE